MSKRSCLIVLGLLVVISILLYCGFQLTPKNALFFLSKRIPRLIAMILVGLAIASATLLFQTMSQNHILSPDLLGYGQIYTLTQTALVFFLGGTHYLLLNTTANFMVLSLLMIVFSTLIYGLVLRRINDNLYLLLLIGSVLATLFRSAATYFQLLINPNEFTILQNKLIASFTTMNTSILWIAGICLVGGTYWVIKHFHVLDVLQLGNDQAKNLGIDPALFQRKALIIISLLVSISTALVGPVTFLGLISVNGARYLMKTYQHQWLWIASVLLSIFLIVFGQFMIERIFNYTISLTVVLNLIGGLYIIYLILKEKAL